MILSLGAEIELIYQQNRRLEESLKLRNKGAPTVIYKLGAGFRAINCPPTAKFLRSKKA